MTAGTIVHGGCLALWSPGPGWIGVLIQGDSGSGKSDLALRLLDQGFVLVADDRTCIWASGGRLFGACPPAIEGLIEARGLGLVRAPTLRQVEIRLAALCAAPRDRMPDPEAAPLAGLTIPRLRLSALEASAPGKLRRAILSLGAGPQGAYLAAAVNPRGGSR